MRPERRWADEHPLLDMAVICGALLLLLPFLLAAVALDRALEWRRRS